MICSNFWNILIYIHICILNTENNKKEKKPAEAVAIGRTTQAGRPASTQIRQHTFTLPSSLPHNVLQVGPHFQLFPFPWHFSRPLSVRRNIRYFPLYVHLP
jgi:hypothetical protein